MLMRGSSLVKHSMTMTFAGFLALSLSFTLAGCGAEPEPPEPAPEVAEEVETVTPTPTPDPTPVDFVPSEDCALINPEAFSASTEAIDQLGLHVAISPTNTDIFRQKAGPKAQEAFATAKDMKGCYYPLYLHGQAVHQYSAQLTDEVSESFLESLEDSDYARTDIDGRPLYSFTETEDTPMGEFYTHFLYAPLGAGAWLATVHQASEQLDYAKSGIEGVRASNSELLGEGSSSEAGEDS